MKKQRLLKTTAITKGTTVDLAEIEVQFKLAKDDTIAGYGTFFKDLASKVIIKHHWDDLVNEENQIKELKKRISELERKGWKEMSLEDKFQKINLDFDVLLDVNKQLFKRADITFENRIVAVEIGREMLLMILSQPGCEGIRFYEARGVQVTDDKDAVKFTLKTPGETTLVAVGMDKNGNDLDMKPRGRRRNISIMNGKEKKGNDTMHSETNPPRTVKELRGNNKDLTFQQIIDNFTSF